MKLFDCAPAPSPRRVRIFIAEKGVEIPVEQVDLTAGEQFAEAFRARNPWCTVPVLETDDGTSISEVNAICEYLEEKFPEPPLIGHTAEQRAATRMWNARVEQQGLAAVAESFRNKAKGFRNRAVTGALDVEQIPELVPRGRRRMEHFFTELEARLAQSRYIAGDAYSMADITGLVAVEFAGWIKLPLPADATALQRWYKEVAGRPSASA